MSDDATLVSELSGQPGDEPWQDDVVSTPVSTHLTVLALRSTSAC